MSVFSSFQVFGFSGSRSCSQAIALCKQVIPVVAAVSGASVHVGCARGVDHTVFLAFQSCSVVRAAGSRPWQLAQRSQLLVSRVALQQGVLLCFPAAGLPCPASCMPGKVFNGGGSGTWGSAAYAVSIGGAVMIWASIVPAWVSVRGQQVAPGCWFIPSAHQVLSF